jgi:DNA polymerase III alpha subunit
LRKVNKRVIESLIKCGAFDSLGYKRSQLMEHYEEAMDEAQRSQKEKMSNQSSFFDQFNSGDSSGDKWSANRIKYRTTCLNGIIKNSSLLKGNFRFLYYRPSVTAFC